MSESRSAREHLLMDEGWRFHLGDVSVPPPADHTWTYLTAKACASRGAAAADFDATSFFDPARWRSVDLPHDWAVEGPFDVEENLDHGYRARNVAWYRRKFRLEPGDEGKYLALDFDGVGTHCTVWVNGQLLHRNWCGYTGFRVEFADVASFGDALNTVVVRVDATEFEGWWYEGAGIYRHVWLVKADPVHVAQWGTFVNPARRDGGDWDTGIETMLQNTAREAAEVSLCCRIVSPAGESLGEAVTTVTVPAQQSLTVTQNIVVTQPELWSLLSPSLHTLQSEVRRDGELVDCEETAFGYRTIRFDPDAGFLLNDEPVKIKGTCNHQDHAGVGVAVPDAIQAFRVRRLKDMGSNAYRCAHNPPAPELLAACDRLGMLVMDENRNFNSSPEVMTQLEAMVRRDRNHPSIVMWSIFNEEQIQGTPRGRKIAEAMSACIKRLDCSRPVTAAMSGGLHEVQGVGPVLDVLGINYNLPAFDRCHADAPHQPIVASENNCAFSTRGVYETSDETNYFDSYDEQHASWGHTARETWACINERPWIAGYFIWTGFDYRGEPSPHKWPSINSHWGIMDTCGFPKDSFYLHKAFWSKEPVLHLLPHWNWAGGEGEPVRVMAHTNCDEVELFLNERSLGRQDVELYTQPTWEVPFSPGRLHATGYRAGHAVAEAVVETTGEASGLSLESDRASLVGDGEDTVPVRVAALDSEGRSVPTAQNCVRLTVTGAGALVGVGNGDPTCHESDKGSERSLFNGLCQAIVRAGAEAGVIHVCAESEGLEAAYLDIPVAASSRRPFVPVPGDYVLLRGWRMSPVTQQEPDAAADIADHDVNTWEQVEVGDGPQTALQETGGYVMFRAWQSLPRRADGTAFELQFGAITGDAEVFIDGVSVARTEPGAQGVLRVPLPQPGRKVMAITVLLKAPAGGGITGPVKLVAADV